MKNMLLICSFLSNRNKGKDFRKRVNEMESDEQEDINNETRIPSGPSSTPMNSTPVAKKSKLEKGKPRFRWTPEMIDTLIDCLNEEKTKCEFKGTDFEADLVSLYTNIRTRMAEIYEGGEFGPVAVQEIKDGLNTKDLALEKS